MSPCVQEKLPMASFVVRKDEMWAMTDYEEKFYRSGLPIHRCEATAHPIEATEAAYEKSEERENSVEERGED